MDNLLINVLNLTSDNRCDPARILRILEKILVLWEAFPDQQLGRLLDMARTSSKNKRSDMFGISDVDLENGLDWIIKHAVRDDEQNKKIVQSCLKKMKLKIKSK